MAKAKVWMITGASRGIGHAVARRALAWGDRVALLARGDSVHQAAAELGERALGIPAMGAIMHAVNIRLSAEYIAYIINHAEDRIVLLEASLVDTFSPVCRC